MAGKYLFMCCMVGLALLGLTGCGDEPQLKGEPEVQYRVTLTNISQAQTFVDAEGQPVTIMLAPGVFAVSEDGALLFEAGAGAPLALETLAETGDPTMLMAAVKDRAAEVGLVGDTDNPSYEESPLMPGAHAGFVVTLKPNARLSLAMMLGPSNDTFLGTPAGGVDLAALATSGAAAIPLQWWDAGTEVNEPLGRGPSQVAQAPCVDVGQEEGGVVSAAPLIDADGAALLPEVAQVVRVEVERL